MLGSGLDQDGHMTECALGGSASHQLISPGQTSMVSVIGSLRTYPHALIHSIKSSLPSVVSTAKLQANLNCSPAGWQEDMDIPTPQPTELVGKE